MQNTAQLRNIKSDRKLIRVSVKRQLTIPQKYFDALGFNSDAECILQDDGILIRPIHVSNSNDFSEQILSDLISQGYEGQILLEKFKDYSNAIRPAVLKLLEENEEFAQSGKGHVSMDELFQSEEK